MNRAPLLLLLPSAVLALAACAGQQTRACEDLAGPGWSPLAQPPANAADLLSRTDFAGESGVVWLGKGDDAVMACVYGHGLTNPGCGGSQGVEYQRQDGRWVSKGVVLDVCHTPPIT